MNYRITTIPPPWGGTGYQAHSEFSFISRGSNNVICAGACHSAIIGGSGNTVNHKWATVSGCNVVSLIDNSFHTNNVIVQDIPVLGGGVARQLQYTPAPAILGLPPGTLLVVTT